MNLLVKNLIIIALSFTFIALSNTSQGCSRITYDGLDNLVVTGRTMDWMEDMQTDLWALPAGVKRVGSTEQNSVEWTSKYGSVIASGYNIGTADGINTQGLSVNLLYLSSSDYGQPVATQKNLSILNWAQYFLDNYATVDEAVKDFTQDKFNMIAPPLPNGSAATVHLSITDRSGNNAIFEYEHGKLMVHRNKAYTVMTNEPVFEKQLTLNDYWQNLDGKFLPGTGEPADRFVRASYYLKTAPKTADPQKAAAIVFSIIRDVSVPMSAVTSGRPNVAATLWRSVADLKDGIYFFENTDRPNIFWVNLSKLDLKPGVPIKKLSMQNGEVYSGEVSDKFVTSKPFFSTGAA